MSSALVEANCSSRYAALFLESSVRPKIQQASSVITRMLLQASLLFGARYGSILADSIVVPMLCGDEKSIGSSQAEAITRILRSDNAVPRDRIDDLVRQTLESANAKASQVGAEAPRHLLTNESALLVFQNVFAAKPALTPRTVELFVAACELALDGDGGADLESSLKFATAIFTLISKYPEQVSKIARVCVRLGTTIPEPNLTRNL